MENENLRIIYLEAENVKRLKAVRIKPDKTLVRIEGRNGAGKSTVLDIISMCLGGEKWVADVPLRTGESKGKCFVVLGTDDRPVLKAQRRFTAKGGNVLEVFDAGGNKLASPQAVLNELYDSDLVFEPLEFVRMPPKDQAALLRKLAGLDFTALDQEREQLYAERTRVNRDAKAAAASVGVKPEVGVNEPPIDIRGLADKQQDAISHNRKVDDADAAVERATEELQRQQAAIKEFAKQYSTIVASERVVQATLTAAVGRRDTEGLRDTIAQTEERLKALVQEQQEAIAHNRDVDNLEAAVARASKDVQQASDEGVELEHKLNNATTIEHKAQKNRSSVERQDVADLGAEILNAEQHNASVKARADWEDRSKQAKAKAVEGEALSDRIDAIDNKKDAALVAAKFPLDGLSVDATGPTLNGVPFSQASSSEQLRTSVAIGLSQKTRARIMLCRDGSLLDTASLEDLQRIAEEFDAQVFVERVADEASPAAVFIDDGEVVSGGAP
jgi:DNA repair exonuclease SbcCD ATPase subunit